MDTQTLPSSCLSPEAPAVLDGTGLDLQGLLDEATALLHACDIPAALERVELAWMLHHDPRLPPIAQGLREAVGNPRRLVAHCLREADASLEAGDAEGARRALEQARELEPRSPLVLNALGWFLAGQDDLAGAQVAFMDVLRLCPASPRAHANLAGICLRRGLRERAVHHLRRSLALDPAFAPARAALAELGEPCAEVPELARPVVARAADGTVWTGLVFLPLQPR